MPGLGTGVVAGGAASRARLARLLGVAAGRSRGIEVRSAAWAADHVEVEVAQPGRAAVVFSIERARQDQPCFLALDRLALTYRGQGGPDGQGLDPVLEAAIRAVAPRGLGRLSIEDLAALFAADPDAGRATEPLPEAPAGDQRDYDEQALLSTWGSAGVWSSFFATAEIARSQLDSLDFFDRCTFVQHCDLECLCVNPQLGAPAIPVVLYPWDDRVRRLDWPPERARGPERGAAEGPGMITTGLTEADVILGRGPSRLAAALDHLAARSGPVGAMVLCSSTCVPVVAGEDVESVVASRRDRFATPLLYLTTTPASMQGVFRDLLVTRRLEAERSGPLAPDPAAVNLLGFPEDPALDELRALLGEAGVRVNVALLPALSPELVDRLPLAALDVVHPNVLWQGHYDQLLFDTRLRSIAPPAPFGRAGSARWLEAVAAAVGADAGPAAARAFEQGAAEWASLRQEAAGHRLGFVVRAADARFLTDPAQTWGVPLLSLVEEMGFGAVVMLGAGRADDQAEAALRAQWRDQARLEVARFAGRDELATLLRRGPADAVYSERFGDRRLAEAGLPGFSAQYFERGFAGAARSLRRLLEVCRLPFFRRYGRLVERGARARRLPDALGRGQGRTT